MSDTPEDFDEVLGSFEYLTHEDWEDEAWVSRDIDGNLWAETIEGDFYEWDAEADEDLNPDGWAVVTKFAHAY